MLKLTSEVEVKNYLTAISQNDILIDEISLCSDGNVNWVWRIKFSSLDFKKEYLRKIKLDEDVKIDENNNSIILKYAASELHRYPNLLFSIDRMYYEINSLMALSNYRLHKESKVIFKTPKVYYYDVSVPLFLMEDFGDDCLNLRQWMEINMDANSPVNFHKICDIGSNFGIYLANIHLFEIPNIKKNQPASQFLKAVVYDEMKNFLEPVYSNFNSTIIEECVFEANKVYHELFENRLKDKYLIMGDIWPSALLFLSNGGECGLIDWEFSGLGNNMIDLISFLFWCWMLSEKNEINNKKSISEAYILLANHFWTEYNKIIPIESSDFNLMIRQFGILLILEATTSDEWCQKEYHSINITQPMTDPSLSQNTPDTCKCRIRLLLKGVHFLVFSNDYAHVIIEKFLKIKI